MKKFVQAGRVESGKLHLANPTAYQTLLKEFEGLEVRVTIQSKPKGSLPRSLIQNGYLWAAPYKLIAEHTGHTPDEIHTLMGSMFLKEVVVVFKETFTVIKSTARLNTAEFSEYVDSIRAWAEKNLSSESKRFRIPLPDEMEY